jgi:hypothetical protein
MLLAETGRTLIEHTWLAAKASRRAVWAKQRRLASTVEALTII